MTQEQAFGIVRHLLTVLAGYGLARGWFDDATMNALVTGGMAIGTVGWSILAKRKA